MSIPHLCLKCIFVRSICPLMVVVFTCIILTVSGQEVSHKEAAADTGRNISDSVMTGKVPEPDKASVLLEEILAGRNDAAWLYSYSMPGGDLADSSLLALEQAGLPAGFRSVALKNELGRIYLEKGNLQKADSFIQVAIEENRRLSGYIKNPEIVMSYYYKSRLVQQYGFINESIGWVNKAMEEAHFEFRAKNLLDLPDNVQSTVSPQAFFRCLRLKAALLYQKFRSENQPAWLDRSVLAFVKAVELNRFILRNLDNESARRFYIENSKTLYDEAMPVVYQACLHNHRHMATALFMLESYKGSELAHALRVAHLHARAKVPGKLLQQEKTTQQLLQRYYTRIHSSNYPSIVQITSKHIGYLQQQLSYIRTSIDLNLSSQNLYAADIDRKGILKKMQTKLDNKTLLINYYVCGKKIFLFYLSKTKAGFEEITLDQTFYLACNTLIENTIHSDDGKSFKELAQAKIIYDYLIKPVERVSTTYSRWVIIPDDYLYNIPFDVLCRKAGMENALLHFHSISYHFAFRLLLNNSGDPNSLAKKKDSVLAFAPFAFALGTGLGIRPLPFSEEELMFPLAQKVLRQKAIKPSFLEQYRNYKYLHLATHASPDSSQSDHWIMFYPQKIGAGDHKLYMNEIYNLNLYGTRLVTLSACQTASGNILTGEGPVSFSRAFLYAGASGVVSTMYKTDDQVTAYIMQKMYGYIQQGYAEAKALQQAKIDLLNDQAIDPKLKQPRFWANFIYTGIYEKEKGPFNKALLLLLLFLVPGLWMAVRYFNKMSS